MTKLAEINFKKTQKKLGITCMAICVIILSIIGGCRDVSVGVDTAGHISTYFKRTIYYNSMVRFILEQPSEPLYLFINYIVSRATKNINWLLFVFQLITYTFVFGYAYKKREQISILTFIMMFLFLFYNRSFNLVRQTIAMSIVLFSTIYAERHNAYKSIIFIVLAMGFHITAVIGLLLYFIICDNRISTKTLIIVLGTFCIFCFRPLGNILIRLGILNSKYVIYFGDSFTTFFQASDFLICLLMALISCILIRSKGKKQATINSMSLCCILLELSAFVITHGQRLAYYALMILVAVTSQKVATIKNKRNQYIYKGVLLLTFGFYWWYVFIFVGSSGTYPYTSGILNIN